MSKESSDNSLSKRQKNWQVYLLECADGSFYCGVTTDLEKRLFRHNLGTAAKYTRTRRPVSLIAQSPWLSKSQAFALEYRVKRLPKHQKVLRVQRGELP